MAGLDKIDIVPALTRFSQLPKLQKGLALGAVAVCIVAFYWFSIYGGKRTEVLALNQRLTQLEVKLNESRAIASNFATFEQEIAQLEDRFQAAVQRLPNSTELPVLLTDITSLGKKSGLEVHSFRPGMEVRRGFYAEVPIQLEIEGPYHSLGMFFDRISRLSRIVQVAEVSMSVKDSEKDPPVLAVKGVARTFRFVEQAGTEGK